MIGARHRDDGLPANVPTMFLYPGTMYCAAQPRIVSTVLGSCVAVCLIDRRRGISGLNHYLLPQGREDKASLRHGETAIPLLLDEMLRLGCRPGDIEAKVFGGAAVLSVNKPEDAVGAKNIAVALACLRTLDIEIVARRTGGKSGMLVRLFTVTGEVLVRRVSPASGWPDEALLSGRGGRLRA